MSKRTRRKRKTKRGTGPDRPPNHRKVGSNGASNRNNGRTAVSETLESRLKHGLHTAVDWIDKKPRDAALSNVANTAIQGALLGLLMGLLAGLVTSDLPKVWTYGANTLAVMIFRVIMQWFWVLKAAPLAHSLGRGFIKKRTGLEVPKGVEERSLLTTQMSTLITPALVSLAIATMLATEPVGPSWLTTTWAIALMSTTGAFMASILEALCLPSNIYALRWNRHPYHDHPNYERDGQRRP